jgi:hypothetical protein
MVRGCLAQEQQLVSTTTMMQQRMPVEITFMLTQPSVSFAVSEECEMFQTPDDSVQHAVQPSLQQQQQQHAAFEEYLSMPFWQQLQQGSHQQQAQPTIGPLGQALAAGMQSSQAGQHSMQPQQHNMQQQALIPAAQQQQQQQHQQQQQQLLVLQQHPIQQWQAGAAAQQQAHPVQPTSSIG